jgi:hypothetical protein
MALPIDSSAADRPPVDANLTKGSKIAAIGYAVLCVYYLGILVIMLAKVPWTTFDQVASDLSSQFDSILALAVFMLANAVLAISALKVLSMYRWAFWCVLLASIIAALCFIGIFVFSLVVWRSSEMRIVGWWTILISTVQLLIYGSCAASLSRVGLVRHRRRKEARMLAMEPLPTTTL